MSAKDIVFKVAEGLPEDATVLDAINNLELLAAMNEGSMEALNATNAEPSSAPSWLYQSPSRLTTIRHRTRK